MAVDQVKHNCRNCGDEATGRLMQSRDRQVIFCYGCGQSTPVGAQTVEHDPRRAGNRGNASRRPI